VVDEDRVAGLRDRLEVLKVAIGPGRDGFQMARPIGNSATHAVDEVGGAPALYRTYIFL